MPTTQIFEFRQTKNYSVALKIQVEFSLDYFAYSNNNRWRLSPTAVPHYLAL